MPDPVDTIFPPLIEPGARVAIRDRFTGEWARGFTVLDRLTDGWVRYLVRRPDGSPIPVPFGAMEVIPDAPSRQRVG
jgi:hypothetical protein